MLIRRVSAAAAVVLFVVFVLTGCVVTPKIKVEKGFFGPKKRFAVVSIAAAKKLEGEKGMSQMFKDNIPGQDTKPIINRLAPQILDKLSGSRHLSLMPEGDVLSSGAYSSLNADKAVQKVLFMEIEYNTARNYKFVMTPEKYAKLAKALKVDGVIGITYNFSVSSSKSGVNVAGVSLGRKSYSAVATATIQAYDRSGKLIWQDSTVKEAEPGDTKSIVIMDFSDITKTNFEAMHPSAISIGAKAMDVLIARFNDAMAGKSVSRVQKMKD